MAEKCTKTSSPVERWINPYPLAPLNHFTVPFSLTKKLLSPLLRDLTSASSVKLVLRTTPSKDTEAQHDQSALDGGGYGAKLLSPSWLREFRLQDTKQSTQNSELSLPKLAAASTR